MRSNDDMWTRRAVVAGGALTILFGATPCLGLGATLAPHSPGCRLADADLNAVYPGSTATATYRQGDEPIIYKSGNANFDFALAQTLAKMAEKFEVLPGFAYFDDAGAENAYATPRVRLNNADGTVLMGINLYRRMMRSGEAPEVALAG